MTADNRLDRDLPGILEGLYLGPSPVYRDEVIAAAVGSQQRPSWTFAGRWLPMFEIATRPVLAPRLPWRAIGTVLILVALLLVAAFFVSSRPTKLPPPFGVARNGLIAYSVYGDIYTADATTGSATAIVTGPDLYSRPLFSRDGTKLAFLRTSGPAGAYDLMVARADGSDMRAVPGSRIEGLDAAHDYDFEWTADGHALLVYAEPQIVLLDVAGSGAPVVLSHDALAKGRLGPSGRIPYQPASNGGGSLWTIGIDGSAPKLLIRTNAAMSGVGDFWDVRYSPDGSMLAFEQNLRSDPNAYRIFVANADGTEIRRLTNVTGPGEEADIAWSPDSRQIAFNRSVPIDAANPAGTWEYQPIGLATVSGAGGSYVFSAGPSQGSQGAIFDWAPDGSALFTMPNRGSVAVMLTKPTLIDQATGEARAIDLTTNALTSWQRLAP